MEVVLFPNLKFKFIKTKWKGKPIIIIGIDLNRVLCEPAFALALLIACVCNACFMPASCMFALLHVHCFTSCIIIVVRMADVGPKDLGNTSCL